ncbi:hypothetical protein [Tautonia plasticadhaerens]|uniref:PEP-CTERM protein-sorting domain-containing protein n=1 Tax=Tautonia plasticadhaerens TaxID=2527974 RepID=A0A518GUR8_9BACT|nr:hypothetical protein [Tautonia plasticadhaerens]QDV32329.1 hypothetical protein ElP_01570 [Tautonia plasticadhaerens]
MRRSHAVAVLASWAALAPLVGPIDRAGAELVNPGFEAGLDGYSVEGSDTVTTDPTTPPPTSGAVAGMASTEPILFGSGGPETDVLPTQGDLFALLTTDGVTATKLSQTFALPAVGPITTLDFDFRFMTDDIDSGPDLNDAFLATLADESGAVLGSFGFTRDDLQPGGSGGLTPLAILGVGGYTAGTDWLVGSIDVSAFLGQTVTLSFTVFDVGDEGVVSAVALDNLRFGVIPEPSSFVLALGGAVAVLALGLRRRGPARADRPAC